MEILTLHTGDKEQMLPITHALVSLVRHKNWYSGAILVFCPHTTAALTINEAADPDVQQDMSTFMGKLVPQEKYFNHREGNSDAHIKTSLFGPHCLLILDKGNIRLGTWQGVYLCEWDGPRERNIWVRFLPAEQPYA